MYKGGKVHQTTMGYMLIEYIFLIFPPNIDCECLLEPLHQGDSNEYLQSMFLSQHKKDEVHPFKPHFTLFKIGVSYAIY